MCADLLNLMTLPLLRSPFSSAPIRAAFLSRCTVWPDTRGHVTECGALAFLQSLCYTDKQEIVPCPYFFLERIPYTMDVKEILRHVDHTLLAPTATWEGIRQICDDGIKYGCASVCIPQTYVAHAAHYIAEQQHYGFGQLPVCTVIGFPNGYVPSGIKCMEAESAVADGATEIDMVINLGWVKEGQYDKILQEINSVKISCHGNILKVIIETCMLTDEEKIKLCEVVSNSAADYIKTSTGFGGGGATREDVALFAKHIGPNVKIKAAGGVSSMEDLEMFLELGCDRIGTSRAVGLCKGELTEGY